MVNPKALKLVPVPVPVLAQGRKLLKIRQPNQGAGGGCTFQLYP
jgi:hypothetical protein